MVVEGGWGGGVETPHLLQIRLNRAQELCEQGAGPGLSFSNTFFPSS